MLRNDRRERLAGPVSLGPDGLLKLEFEVDDDVIAPCGLFTEFVVEEICASIDEQEFDDHELESLVRTELAARCRSLRAYQAYLRFRAATESGRTFATFVADPAFQSRRRYSGELGGLYTELKSRDTRPLATRPANTFREYWSQQYVAANYTRLGFNECKGPYEHGPDFHLRRQDTWHVVEVETEASSYFNHGHHRDPRWKDCRYLIALENDLSAKQARIAPEVICIERDHFGECQDRCRVSVSC